MVDKELYTPGEIHCWQDLVAYQDQLPKPADGKWIYRGQRTHRDVDLAPSLERSARALDISWDELRDRELKLLREFKRRLHHYTSDIPDARDHLEWLAVMQHYGAPTRLLDWTYSFFIAAFFAVEKTEAKECEVWALNTDYFSVPSPLGEEDTRPKNKYNSRRRDHSSSYQDVAHAQQDIIVSSLLKWPRPCVRAVNPFRLNERLTLQQGVFLFPGDIGIPFEKNLCASQYTLHSSDNLVRFKIVLDSKARIRIDILERLHRVNVDRAVLFPGLAGFAESLKTRLGFLPEI